MSKTHFQSAVLHPPAPLAYEPFSTLAMIYDDDGDTDKALQFGLIAAHLNPSDCEEWIRLAEMSLGQDNIRQAVVCYTKGQSDGTRYDYLGSNDPREILRLTGDQQPSSTTPPTCATCGSAPVSTCVWGTTSSAWTATAGSCCCSLWRTENTSCSCPRTWPSMRHTQERRF